MAIGNEKNIMETEAVWSDANKKLLNLNTASWRTVRPVIDQLVCNRCGICFNFCPQMCIAPDEAMEKYVPNLEVCKGCGVCAKECPLDCINMAPEGDFRDDSTP